MEKRSDAPIYVTGDIDWCSEFCLENYVAFFNSHNIKPLLFVTHHSDFLYQAQRDGLVDLGIHPNFDVNSSHGSDIDAVINTVFEYVPDAVFSRSHSFHTSSRIEFALSARGITYESSLCMFNQTGITALRHWTGFSRYPIFWEDDVHWTLQDKGAISDIGELEFASSGLKILNIHPFNFCMNIGSAEGYQRVKSLTKSVTENSRVENLNPGEGTTNWTSWILENFADQVVKERSLLDDAEILLKGISS